MGLAEAIGDYVRAGYCLSMSNIATLGELFGGSDNPGGAIGIPAARWITNNICNRPAPSLPAPPFTGGQCLGIQYRVTIDGTYTVRGGIGTPVPFTTSIIAGGIIENVDLSTTELESSNIIRANVTSNGSIFFNQVFNGGGNNTKADATITNISIVRPDGLPDNCGSPTPVIPPYTPGGNTTNNNITYVDEDGNNVSIGGSLTLGYVTVNIDGTVSIPFTLNAELNPTANLNGNFNLNTGDINFDYGNPSLPSNGCQTNSDNYNVDVHIPPNPPGVPPEPETPDPNAEKPEKRKLLKGCYVTTTTIPPAVTEIFQAGAPNVYAPDLGLISFQISVNGASGWTEDIRVKNIRQFISCPWEGGATDVKGTPRLGGLFTISPVYLSFTDGKTFPD
jgi:hypothetical protein